MRLLNVIITTSNEYTGYNIGLSLNSTSADDISYLQDTANGRTFTSGLQNSYTTSQVYYSATTFTIYGIARVYGGGTFSGLGQIQAVRIS